VALAIFYTWPLKHIALGEITVLVVWGPLMVGGGYYVITGVWDWQVVMISLPYALGPTAVIFGKHIDKLKEDRGKVLTLPVLLGDTLSRNLTILMLLSQYLLVAYLVVAGTVTPLLLLVALALPTFFQAVRVYRLPAPQTRPEWFPAERWPLWFVAHAFNHNRRFGALFLAALLADTLYVVYG
jgi:1,4-dihydroxy-2-naphthoate octaprenyltransferase